MSNTPPKLEEGVTPEQLEKQRQKRERDQKREQSRQQAEQRRLAEERLKANPRPTGFVTVIQQNGVPVLGYRPGDNKPVEAVVPMPSRNVHSFVHVASGSLIDLSRETPIVTTFADEEDVRVAYTIAEPVEGEGQETLPPVQA